MQIGPVAATAKYTDNDFKGDFASGFLKATGADLLVNITWGTAGATQDRVTDFTVPNGSILNLTRPGQPGYTIQEVQFKNAGAATCTVTGYLQDPTGAGLQLILGAATSGGTVNIQHNDVLVAAEPTLDFEDSAGFTWVITDDPANTRVKITPPAAFPGNPLAYVEFTAPVTINTVAEAASTLVVSSGAVVYDGTPVWVEFFCPAIVAGGAVANAGILLADAGTSLGRLFDGTVVASTASGYDVPCGTLRRKLTPTPGSHTFQVRAWNTAGTNWVLEAGAGGAGVDLPGYVAVYKA